MDADDSDDLIYGDSNYSNNDSYDHIDIDTKDRHDGDDIPHDCLRSAANYYYESLLENYGSISVGTIGIISLINPSLP